MGIRAPDRRRARRASRANSKRTEELSSTQVPPQKTAAQIMSSPVRTILPTVSMDEAGRIMIRHGLDGLLIAENDRVIGVVSRRDIDQAMHHKLRSCSGARVYEQAR